MKISEVMSRLFSCYLMVAAVIKKVAQIDIQVEWNTAFMAFIIIATIGDHSYNW